MRPRPGEVLHFSEDPGIERFEPHVAATSQQLEAYVWAVDAANAPSYWFPRQCPRAMAWPGPEATDEDVARILGPGRRRVHAVEYRWLARIRAARVFAYRFDAGPFRPFGDARHPHAHVAVEPVVPLAPPEPIGDLLALHEDAGIELRVMANLWPFWEAVTASTVEFSGIRLRNAVPPSVVRSSR